MGNSRGRWDGDVFVVEVTGPTTARGSVPPATSTAAHWKSRAYAIVTRTPSTTRPRRRPERVFAPADDPRPLHRQNDLPRLYEYQCHAEKTEANGEFERDRSPGIRRRSRPRTCRSTRAPAARWRRRQSPAKSAAGADGKPDLSGWYQLDAGGGNYGLESSPQIFLTPASRGLVIDPPDGQLPYQTWARNERIARAAPHRGYDDPTAHCFVAGIPRSHYVPQPVHILQPPGYVVVLFERMSWRHIATEPAPRAAGPRALVARRLAGPLGRRHARRREQELQRQSVAQRGRRHRESPADRRRALHARRRGHASSIARRSATRSRTLGRGRSRCRCIARPTSCSRSRATRTTQDLEHLKHVRDEYRATQQEN